MSPYIRDKQQRIAAFTEPLSARNRAQGCKSDAEYAQTGIDYVTIELYSKLTDFTKVEVDSLILEYSL